MEQTECSNMSAYKIQTPGNHQNKEYNIQNAGKVWNQELLSSWQDLASWKTYIFNNTCLRTQNLAG